MWQDKVRLFVQNATKGNFNQIFRNVKIIEIEKGRLVAELKTEMEHCNYYKIVHGGFTGTMIDFYSTVALRSHFLAESDTSPDSVSLELSFSYLAGIPCGNTLRLETETVKVGKSIAFLTGRITDLDTGKLAVTGKHTKYLQYKK